MVPISRLRSPRHRQHQHQHQHQHHTSKSSSSSSSSSLEKSLPPPPSSSNTEQQSQSQSHCQMTTILVGAKKHPFSVNRQLLCNTSPFFSKRLQDDSPKPISLWLPSESSTMFALFVQYVHSPSTFRRYLDHSVATALDTSDPIHWAIIRLHLFASHLDLYKLQDLAMDALQDLYLNRNWDVPPSLIIYLYTQCESLASVRMRRWAVAMVAFSLTVDTKSSKFRALFASLPDFAEDYATHVRNMKAAGLDIRFKNPQLRIPANKLRNDERLFGFRECSFHSHRAAVGERRCPYDEGAGRPEMMMGLGVSLRDGELMPRPLFAREESKLRHVRSISSGLRDG